MTKILVVDDSQAEIRLLQAVLQDGVGAGGSNVTAADDGDARVWRKHICSLFVIRLAPVVGQATMVAYRGLLG